MSDDEEWLQKLHGNNHLFSCWKPTPKTWISGGKLKRVDARHVFSSILPHHCSPRLVFADVITAVPPLRRHWARVTRADRGSRPRHFVASPHQFAELSVLFLHIAVQWRTVFFRRLKRGSAHNLLMQVQMQALKSQWISMCTCGQMRMLSGNTVRTKWMDKTIYLSILANPKWSMKMLMDHWCKTLNQQHTLSCQFILY